MIHIKVITLRQLIGIIAAVIIALALIVFAVFYFAKPSGQNELASADFSFTQDVQAEDLSACVGQALPMRSGKTSYLQEKLPQLIHLIFGFDPTDTMSIFAHAMPGASIADEAVIEGLDTARLQSGGALPQVTVRFEDDGQGIGLTLRNRLFSSYRTDEDLRVFVYHSHTTEAYADSVATTSAWRSRDDSQNMIGVGDALCTALDSLSVTTSHDRSYHENPNYNYAYSHSMQSLQAEFDAYPKTDLFIDVHRDAWIEGSSRARAVQVDGHACAQVQFVIGRGTEDSPNPHWRENAALAEAITDELERIAPGITIPVRYVNSRYNQQVAPGCILVEIGHNENTLAEAHLAAKYLAQAIGIVLSQT